MITEIPFNILLLAAGLINFAINLGIVVDSYRSSKAILDNISYIEIILILTLCLLPLSMPALLLIKYWRKE